MYIIESILFVCSVSVLIIGLNNCINGTNVSIDYIHPNMVYIDENDISLLEHRYITEKIHDELSTYFIKNKDD